MRHWEESALILFVEALEGLADGTATAGVEDCGICEALEAKLGKALDESEDCMCDDGAINPNAFNGWKYHSGWCQYPVPGLPNDEEDGPPTGVEANIRFHYHEDLDSMWIGAYGDLRKDLCRYILQRIGKGEVEVLLYMDTYYLQEAK